MNGVNSEVPSLIELFCEIELGDDEEPRVTKVHPKTYTDGDILKILPNFAFPFRIVANNNNNKVER